jgi:hypothetical protein
MLHEYMNNGRAFKKNAPNKKNYDKKGRGEEDGCQNRQASARSLDQMVKKMFQIDEKRQRTSRKGCIVEPAGRVA